MAARAASILSDAIVLFLTSLKTFLKSRSAAELTSSITTVRGALLRGTSVCFVFLSVINVIAIVATRATMSISIAQEWINILTSIFLSRLAMDLRETALLGLSSTTGLDASTLDFAGVDSSEGSWSDVSLEDVDVDRSSVSNEGHAAELEC
ncbi:uncharacterized protein C8Q71DRAFT_80808 [Rhodofomes roseus]|uniref:ABC transmembrane type-1 domain-containing protein n=1 Tax=Rhodofomes roseus TaxID=34475 RepID=A0ABQ8KF86_9APHY|nr:uncharacterized protein C8Q71DRAFT_80808 [Rhodofomes roseus]KAH9836382.1 hypothetical protein C8Q71DRAFT_80808 [Rhodofomes roseus]